MIQSISQIKLWEMKQIFVADSLKFKIKMYLCVRGFTAPSTPYFNTLSTPVKYLKSLFNLRNYIKIFKEIRTNLSANFKFLMNCHEYLFHFPQFYLGYRMNSFNGESLDECSHSGIKYGIMVQNYRQ